MSKVTFEGPPGGRFTGGIERHREPAWRQGLQHRAGHIGDARAIDAAVLPGRARLPVGDVAVPPVLGGQVPFVSAAETRSGELSI